jgi:hypothetical protein
MNEQEPSLERQGRHAKPTSLDTIGITSDNVAIRGLWEEGLTRWGHAFAAYTRLGTAELHTSDVLTDFEDLYIASFDDVEALIADQLEGLGWTTALKQFMREQGIADDLLNWNREALVERLRLIYDVIESGGRIHAFAK